MRQRHYEGCTVVRRASRGDFSTVPLRNLAADRKSHASTVIFGPAVQPLEYSEDAIQILLVKANAVIFHNKLPRALVRRSGSCCMYPDDQWFVLFVELQTISDQVLQKLSNLHGIRFNDR